MGKIDNILVDPNNASLGRLHWCAVEKQAVYFSGSKMATMFQAIRNYAGSGIPKPDKRRRPDWRSSGVKRLMPQLQIKAKKISNWGTKLAVVTDHKWFEANIGDNITKVDDLSNCEIVWFVFDYEKDGEGFGIYLRNTYFLELTAAIEALTGGVPLPKTDFEAKIVKRVDDDSGSPVQASTNQQL